MKGFELSTWSADHGFTVGTTLPDYGVMQLLKDLGLAMYMKENTCTPSWFRQRIKRLLVIYKKRYIFIISQKVYAIRRFCGKKVVWETHGIYK